MPSLQNVILSNPTLLKTSEFRGGKKDEAKRSWIQLARTGSFHSNRYGKFSITKTDLTQMLANFTDITPKAPTELPVDFDHLSMDPKKPGDGIAAGWMKKLELRGDDKDELWAEVEWTPGGAERIANQEYRFVSPSFVKDHVHKDGKKIGTTLLAAAITNHPFLEGMRALTLYNFSAHGDLALPPATSAEVATISLAEIGQRVMIAPGNARTQDEIGGTFEIAEVIGEGDDAFVSVKDAGGLVHKWFRMTELLPASTVPANPAHPSLQPGQQPVIPAQLPGVPVQPAAQSTNPAQAAAAAAGLDPAAAAAAAADPAAAAAGIDPAAAAKGVVPNPFAKDGEEKDGDEKKDAKENEGATGGEGAALVVGKKKKDGEDEPDEDELDEMLRKAMAMLAGGAPQPKGIAHMMFTLRNDKNEEIKVSSEQLAAAGINIVPEGSTAIPTTELSELKGTITNLSSTVDVLKADVESKAAEARKLELNSLLGGKLKGGFITKVTHDTLFNQFKDTVDLSGLRALVATFTKPVIALNTEHGVGSDAQGEKTQGEQATGKILALSNQIAKERGISLSDAVKLAGAQLAGEADTYRESFANVAS
jgi:phage I-like protein